jgi:16S rRNA (adenine1518-N6/adenine1519-N6)-dimethyltransferase
MFRTIKAAFAQRRKTLSNALAAGFSELTKEQINDVIANCGFEPTVRGERLDIAEFVALSDKIGELIE